MKEVKWFENTDLDCNYTRWQIDNITTYTLPPLSIGKELRMIKNKKGIITGVDFKLFVFKQEFLIFHELITEKKYGFDTSEILSGKIYFRLETGQVQTWKKIPLI